MEWLETIIDEHQIKSKEAGETAKQVKEKKLKELDQRISAVNHAANNLILPLLKSVEATLNKKGCSAEVVTSEEEERQTKRNYIKKLALVLSRSHSGNKSSDGIDPAFRIIINVNDSNVTVSYRTNTCSQFEEISITLENLTPTTIEPMLQKYMKTYFAVT